MRILLADRCSVSQQLGALRTHSFSFLTQWTYSCSIVKEMPGSVASGTPYMKHCSTWKARTERIISLNFHCIAYWTKYTKTFMWLISTEFLNIKSETWEILYTDQTVLFFKYCINKYSTLLKLITSWNCQNIKKWNHVWDGEISHLHLERRWNHQSINHIFIQIKYCLLLIN